MDPAPYLTARGDIGGPSLINTAKKQNNGGQGRKASKTNPLQVEREGSGSLQKLRSDSKGDLLGIVPQKL